MNVVGKTKKETKMNAVFCFRHTKRMLRTKKAELENFWTAAHPRLGGKSPVKY